MKKLPIQKSYITKKKLQELADKNSKKITLYVSLTAYERLLKLLDALKKLGSWGASRKINIEGMDKELGSFYFDGDGSDKIYVIEVGE